MSSPDEYYGFAAEEAARQAAFEADRQAIDEVIVDLHELGVPATDISQIETALNSGGTHIFPIDDNHQVALRGGTTYHVWERDQNGWHPYHSGSENSADRAA